MISLYIKKSICVFIVLELLLSGLGYCGHTHTPDHDFDSIGINTINPHEHSGEEHFHTHSLDSNNTCCDKDLQEKKCTEYHCFCLGNFVGESIEISYYVDFEVNNFYPQSVPSYYFLFPRQIYRPPIV